MSMCMGTGGVGAKKLAANTGGYCYCYARFAQHTTARNAEQEETDASAVARVACLARSPRLAEVHVGLAVLRAEGPSAEGPSTGLRAPECRAPASRQKHPP